MPKKPLQSAQTVQRIGAVITGATEVYTAALITMQESVAAAVFEMVEAGLTREAILLELGAMDFAVLMDSLGYPAMVNELTGSYEAILARMSMFGEISESMLTGLVGIEQSSYVAMGRGMAGAWQHEMTKGVLNGLSEYEMNLALRARMNNYNHVRTEVNTMMNTFSRTVTHEQAVNASPKKKFRYEGPQDNKTRAICNEMGAAGDLTLAEVEEEYPGGFMDGGGYHCRHQWVEVDSAEPSNKKNAENIIQERKNAGTYHEPLTVREQLAV